MEQIGQTLTTWISEKKGAPLVAEPRTVKVMGRIFERFAQMLGTPEMGRFFAGLDPNEVQETWARYLAGFTDQEFERGLAHVITLDFMPKIGEFAKACRPCLNAEYAFHEAGKCLRQRDEGKIGDWTHPAVWRAACTLSMEVRSGDYGKNRTRWGFELDSELAAGFGEGVPEPLKRLEVSPAVTKPPSEEIRAKLKELRARM